MSTTVTFGFGVFGALWEQLLTGHVTGLSGQEPRAEDALTAFTTPSPPSGQRKQRCERCRRRRRLSPRRCARRRSSRSAVCPAAGAELGCFSIAGRRQRRVPGRSTATPRPRSWATRVPRSAGARRRRRRRRVGALPPGLRHGGVRRGGASVIAQVACRRTKRRTGEGAAVPHGAPAPPPRARGVGEVKVVATLVGWGDRCYHPGAAAAEDDEKWPTRAAYS